MLVLLCALGPPAVSGPSAVEAFEQYSGAKLVFEVSELPGDDWFDRIIPLPDADRERAAAIALNQAMHFPPGTLGDSGLKVVGLFAAVGSKDNDGYHAFDADLDGYRYFGMYNGHNAAIGAYYTDTQLPLTLHHEWHHHFDAVVRPQDNARALKAIRGAAPYPPPAISPHDLAALQTMRLQEEPILPGSVGAYSAKNPNEDQAETARHLHAHLADALLQVVERPNLPGSQRILHVLAEQEAAGVPLQWLVDVALHRHRQPGVHPRVRPNGKWVVWGGEDETGVNPVLRRDVRALGAEGAALRDPGDLLDQLALIVHYHAYVADNWSVTPGTRSAFEEARAAVVDALPTSHHALATALTGASLEELGVLLDGERAHSDRSSPLVPTAARLGVPVNPFVDKVDEAVPTGWAAPMRAAQTTTVRIESASGAASGVVVEADGLILTAAHVAHALDEPARVLAADGMWWSGRCIALDARHDLALIRLDDRVDLPVSMLAPKPPKIGAEVVTIGQPSTRSPDGRSTGFQPFHVSAGRVRLLAADPLDAQSLGGLGHDAWTYWGHSGAPLFNRRGEIVALHNSWDPETGMRHAITWQSIARFLESHEVR